MAKINNFFHQIPFYPILFSVYPVLFLWSANFVQMPAFAFERSLLISIAAAAVICLVCLAIARNLRKAALLAGMAMLFFFFYGQLFSLIEHRSLFGFEFGRHRLLLSLLGIILLAWAFYVLRARSDLRNLTLTFNLVSSFLVGFCLVQLGFYIANDPSRILNQPAGRVPVAENSSTQVVDSNTPDVYYFLLDGYDRQDLLKSDINLDNQPFISDLENLGFVIPDCTHSNYTTTVTSMAATLNMNYLETLGVPETKVATLSANQRTSALTPFTLDNQVMREFRKFGYKIVTLKSPFPFIDFKNSDVIIDYQSSLTPLNKLESFNFEYIFLRTTLLRVLIDKIENAPEKFDNLPIPALDLINPRFNHFQVFLQNLYDLSAMDTISSLPGKKFVYAHLTVTHPPFTFTATGKLRPMDAQYDKQAYADQITYANKRMLTIIKNILAGSKTPPVIVLQGDHGHAVNLGEKSFRVLNAYYLPQDGKAKIYPTITPVNTFRLIFSTYFDQDYPLLPDKSIWIGPKFPGYYTIAPQTCVN